MGTGSFFSSNLYAIYNIVQNTQILYPKELIVSALKDYFSKDSKFHYVKDEWGFPKTPNHTDLPPNAGLNDDLTTRIFIGQENRFYVPFYPAILVKHTGSSFEPISINEEKECVQYESRIYIDEFGQKTNILVPVGFIFAGSWNFTLAIDIFAEDPQSRTMITEAVCMLFQSVIRDQLTRAGVFIKKVSTSGENMEIYQNDNIFKDTVTLDCRGEYRRLIPVESIIEAINVCIDFGPITPNYPSDPNLQINYNLDMLDVVSQ